MTEPTIRMTVVKEAPEGYVHAPVEPEIPVHTEGKFEGLRVIVHTLPTATREAMAKLGDTAHSDDANRPQSGM